MADKQNQIQNPIACEPCRQKKCKCDRILPVCSQCSDPARCNYPESGKRGLPQGYITHLENRLAATERALYSSYAYLRTISPRSFSILDGPQPNPSRTVATNEWSRYPLHTPEDLENWWVEKSRVYGPIGAEVPSDWSPGTTGTTGTTSRDKEATLTTSLNSLSYNHVQERPSAGHPREGRAERLVERESAVYF